MTTNQLPDHADVVLEKYPDFHRDFRGDTIHASTLQVLDELGLMRGFNGLPHQPTRTVGMMTDDGMVTLGDFSGLPGAFQYLCIGDAAHAMSPVAGVGINLAMQDAVQRRRAWPAILTQRIQLLIQRQLISGSGDPDRPVHRPRPLRILSRTRLLQRPFSRFLAIGVRNEHVATPLQSESRPVRARAVPVPATGLLAGALPRLNWSDAYEVACPVDAPTDPHVWADAIFHHAPRWVRGLLAVRQATVALVGIDRGRPNTFDIRTRTDEKVLLGTDERHLSFRASVLTGGDRVVLSTVVQIHNRRGRAYSAMVRLIHPIIVRAMLGRAARILSPTNQGVL